MLQDSAGGGLNTRMQSPLELELIGVESGDKQTVFQSALERSRSLLTSPTPTGPHVTADCDDHDVTLQSVPTPHVKQVR